MVIKTKKIQKSLLDYVLLMAVVVGCILIMQNYFVDNVRGEEVSIPDVSEPAGAVIEQDVSYIRNDTATSPIEPDTANNEANVTNEVPIWGNGSELPGGNPLNPDEPGSIILEPSQGQIAPGTQAALERIDSESERIYEKHNPEGNLYDGNGEETE